MEPIYWEPDYGISLEIELEDAQEAIHPGPCDAEIEALMPKYRDQLDALDENLVRAYLDTVTDWDCSDHETNLERLLWIACGDIVEEHRRKD